MKLLSKIRDNDDLEAFLLVILLGALIAFSFVDTIWSFSDRWTTPALFVALLVILRLLWRLREDQVTTLENQFSQVKSLIENATATTLTELAHRLPDEETTIEFYDSSEAFYGALTEAVHAAHEQIDTTYVRHYPPDKIKDSGADRYFKEVLGWVSQGEGRSLRRIFCVSPENSPMNSWLIEHCRAAREIDNYQWKVIDWPMKVDAINIAIFDETLTFLLVAGRVADKFRGLSIRSENMARYSRLPLGPVGCRSDNAAELLVFH